MSAALLCHNQETSVISMRIRLLMMAAAAGADNVTYPT